MVDMLKCSVKTLYNNDGITGIYVMLLPALMRQCSRRYMASSDEIRAGLLAELGPSPSFVALMMVDAAVNAAEQLTKDPQWHRAFTETLERLHLSKPQRPTQHVATEDDPWLPELHRAFGDLEGRVATADVWKVLKFAPYGRSLDDHVRLTAVMRLLGWNRRLLRFHGGEVRRGFVRGESRRTVYVFICPITREVTVAHNPPSETDRYGRATAT